MFDRIRSGGHDDPEAAREQLVASLDSYIDRDATAEALRSVPRHAFVPEDRRDEAYADRPLPIGGGQTISAPHMVAMMTEALELEPGERVLEIGTGCGYHAAVTAELVGPSHVFSVEYDAELAATARERLADLGYDGVSVRNDDGHRGWPDHAPYDAAYLTCAARSFPDPVVGQVRAGGRVLAPLGTDRQRLVAGVKTPGGLDRTEHGFVRFVPMRGGE